MKPDGKTMKAQISIELITIIGLVLFLFIPLIFVAYHKSGEIRAASDILVEGHLISEVAKITEMVGSSPVDSSMKKVLYIPDSMIKIEKGRAGEKSLIVLTDKYGNQIAKEAGNVAITITATPDARGYVTFTISKKNENEVEVKY